MRKELPLGKFDYSHFTSDVHNWTSTREFLGAPTWNDGIHRIQLPSHHLDLLIRNDVLGNTQGYILVVFNGAVSKRAERTPPFFSRMTPGRALDVPCVSIADTALALTPDLGIGRYAEYVDGQFQLAVLQALRAIGQRTGKHLWLVGGSVGGYAALQYGHFLGAAASVFAWNPQTDFLEYTPPLVRPYLYAAFPQLVTDHEADEHPRNWSERLRDVQVQHSVMAHVREGRRPRRMLVVQNWDDWHVTAHLAPPKRAYGASVARRNLHEAGPDHLSWIRDFGTGHVAPSSTRVIELLRALWAEDQPLLRIVAALEDFGTTAAENHSSFPLWGPGREAVIARLLDWGAMEDKSLCPTIPGIPPKSRAFLFHYRVGVDGRVIKNISARPGNRLALPTLHDWVDVQVKIDDGFGNKLNPTIFYSRT